MAFDLSDIPAGHFLGGSNLDQDRRADSDDLHLAQVLAQMQVHRVPANIETAAFTAAVDATWEDVDIVTLLNTALTAASKDNIDVGSAVMLYGTLEFVNGEAATNNAKYADGETPDNDDTVRTFATAAAAASEYVHGVVLCTDDSGQIKIEVDDKTNLELVFHLTAYQYIRKAAE